MKALKELCLDCLSFNLHGNISCITRDMTTVHKEQLLERLISHDRLTSDYLPYVTYNLFARALTRIVLYRCDQVNDRFLQLLAQSECQLMELTVVGCKTVTNAGIAYIVKNQSELKIVRLKSMPSITGKGLHLLHSPILETLNVSGSSITSDGVAGVLRNNPTIRRLVLSHCKKLDEAVFLHVASCLAATLEVLKVVNMNCLNDENIVHIASRCHEITRLDMYGCNRVSDAGLTEICTKCSNLQDLNISLCMRITTCACLAVLPSTLRDLSLSAVQITDTEGLTSAMQQLTMLRSVHFCGVPAINDEALEQILSSVGSKLELLDLSGGLLSTLTEAALTSVVHHCPELKSLFLSLLKNISGLALMPLLLDEKRAAKLTRLHFACRMLDASVLHCLSTNCPNLEALSVDGVLDVSDEFLQSIALSCSGLRYIGLKGCRQITDAGVCALSRCHQLRCVVLSGAGQLTDRSVVALANNCPYIDEFYASGCNHVSRDAVMRLVDSCIPRVFWEHRIPNAVSGNTEMSTALDREI